MKLLVEISDRTLDRMQVLLETGRFSSAQRFVQLAIENQLGLEEAEETGPPRIDDVEEVEPAKPAESDKMSRRERNDVLNLLSIPQAVETPDVLDPHGAEEIGFRADAGDWLWGQINNCLAVKVAARLLLREVLLEQGHPALSRMQSQARSVATAFGNLLRELDDASGRNRVHRWSKSLPTSESNSQQRFVDQYFGVVRVGGGVRGALPELGLARLLTSEDAEPRVGLTEIGLRLALLENPLLDTDPTSARNKLSREEEAHYVSDVLSASSKESEAFMAIGRILGGRSTPAHELWQRLADLYPTWSDSEVLTYGNGAISRMSDVGLVRRIRPGTSTAEFEPTDTLKEVMA